MSLAIEQRRFVEAIMSSKGSALGLLPSAQLTAEQRLAIYRDSYVSRLVACLIDDYPRVHEALGDARFHELAGRFIARHPSQSFSLNAFGAGFAGWLSRARVLKHRLFFRDLARVEWAMVEAVHAPEEPSLRPESIASAPRFESLVLSPKSSLRILDLDYPIDAYLLAWAADRRPRVPRARRSALAVGRTGLEVWRIPLDLEMANVLRRLIGGRSIAAALAGTTASPALIQTWFGAWMRHGFFRERS